MNRRIPMDNCPNLRHLGGYQSRNGGRVKNNRLFRSGTLSELSDQDLERLSALDLVTIIDFRRRSEIRHNPNRLPERLQGRQQQLNVEPGNLAAAFDTLSPRHVSQHMIDINRALVLEHADSYAAFLQHLLEADGGSLLFHCTAGKDRTGFAAALILMALEVPREIIFEDYLLTKDYFVPEEQAEHFLRDPHFRQKMQADTHDPDLIRDVLIPMLEVKREYLQSAFDAIDQQFKNESAYLSEALGFDRQQQLKLQALYLD